jgi:tRNA threonylcarbamoyladenosine biosynthesis protein TsaB
MKYILIIETSDRVNSIALCDTDGRLINCIDEISEQYTHIELLQVNVDKLLKDNEIAFSDLCAIAVSSGPGSYTGLRIGVSSAKGYAYALDIPLISIPTLELLANGMINYLETKNENIILIPTIDARRMEVYMQMFDYQLHPISEPSAEIFDEQYFSNFAKDKKYYWGGSGAEKLSTLFSENHKIILEVPYPLARYGVALAVNKYNARKYEDIAYFEPFYLKEFIPGKPRVKGLD